MPRKYPQPAYRRHKARNAAVVTLNGKNHYLGPWQSPESHERYARLIAEWKRNNGDLSGPKPATPADTPLTVGELVLAYFRFAKRHYTKNGKPTSEVGCLRHALRPVRKLYGTTPAAEFGPRALKSVRQALVDAGRARKSLNKDVLRIKRVFRWAVEEELLPAAVSDRLRCVKGLGKGRTTARETGKVEPIPQEHVDAVLPHLPPPVAAMVRLQLLAGARPQDVIGLKPGQVADRGDGTWLYTPAGHKTEHLDRDKVIVLGPQAQAVLAPFLARDPDAFCFAPAEAVAWKLARQRKGRPATTDRDPGEYVNESYTRHSYRLAVTRACRKAGVPAWSPRRLRHTRATQIRTAFGSLEAAKAVLGHADTRVTEQHYAARDLGLAAEVMKKIG
jgi:integrase